jgi:hypothetical protein
MDTFILEFQRRISALAFFTHGEPPHRQPRKSVANELMWLICEPPHRQPRLGPEVIIQAEFFSLPQRQNIGPANQAGPFLGLWVGVVFDYQMGT